MMHLSDYFQQFVTREAVSDSTNSKNYYKMYKFINANAEALPQEVTTAMLLDYINNQRWNEATKAMAKSSLHALMEFCGVVNNPADGLPNWSDVPRRVIVPKEDDVIKAMKTAVLMCESDTPTDIRDGLVFTLAMYSGCRRGEYHNLTIDEMFDAMENPEADGVYRAFTDGKTGEAIMRFSGYHLPYIQRYIGMRPDGSEFMFVNLDPHSRWFGQQLNPDTFNRMRWKICERAGIKVVTYKDLRKRLGTIIARADGCTLAAQALGHSPHSGERVVRLFYYDPDKAAVDRAAAKAFEVMT